MRPSIGTAGVVALLLVGSPAVADDMTATELVAALQEGGHVIYIRHASTEVDYADQIDAVMGDCSTQRTLSEEGWHDARLIGAGFDILNIPIGAVHSSQYCRAWQTADLAFGRYEQSADFNFEPFEEYTDEQMAAMRDRVAPHLATVPSPGANTVIVAHDDPFEAATGIYPEPMGVAYVIAPGPGEDFEVLGYIVPDDWADLIGESR